MSALQRLDQAVNPQHAGNANAERSFNRIRLLAGLFGLILPPALLIGDKVFLAGNWTIRGSLSAYYHSGMRDVFVGVLVATGMCLVAYRLTDKGDKRNAISTFAGIMAMLVAGLPTKIPAQLKEEVESVRQTPLQQEFGQGTISVLHGLSALLLILTLCALSVIFWRREKLREAAEGHESHRFGSTGHLACVVLMLASIAWIGINFLMKLMDQAPLNEDFLLYGEWGAVYGFALSFVAQGIIHSQRASDPPITDRQGDPS